MVQNFKIKFRGKDFYTNEWIYSNGLLQHSSGVTTMIIREAEDGFVTSPVWPITVGQYTGIKDKNGNEIYEGDIVNCLRPDSTNTGNIDVVEYKNGAFWLRHRDRTICDWILGYDSDGELWEGQLEVCGNIHQNPEIL